jgi:hypothetical protein
MSKIWENVGEELFFELGMNYNIEELPWNGGKLDVKQFVKTWAKGRGK